MVSNLSGVKDIKDVQQQLLALETRLFDLEAAATSNPYFIELVGETAVPSTSITVNWNGKDISSAGLAIPVIRDMLIQRVAVTTTFSGNPTRWNLEIRDRKTGSRYGSPIAVVLSEPSPTVVTQIIELNPGINLPQGTSVYVECTGTQVSSLDLVAILEAEV